MGAALHRNFSFLDGVVRGEADTTIVPLMQTILRGESPAGVPGVLWRGAEGDAHPGEDVSAVCLDDYPPPDYDDYFAELVDSGCAIPGEVRVPFEVSRGCWFSVRGACRFCGLNGAGEKTRVRELDAVKTEIAGHRSRYGTKNFMAVDNLVPTRHLKQLPNDPQWRGAGESFFFEVRPELAREVLGGLRHLGSVSVQTGIESLVGEALEIMGKGISPLDAVCFLRRGREFGLQVYWNFMCGLPGERADWYTDLLPKFVSLSHLHPPDVVRLSLQRFSTFFESPHSYGIRVLGPRVSAPLVWRLPDVELRDLLYSLEFEVSGADQFDRTQRLLQEAAEKWKDEPGILTVRECEDGGGQVLDSRGGAVTRGYRIGRSALNVLRCLEAPADNREISLRLRSAAPADYLRVGAAAGIEEAVSSLEAFGLVYRHEQQVVALPIPSGDNFWLATERSKRQRRPLDVARVRAGI